MLAFAYTGAAACICFIFIVPAVYFLGSVLVVFSVTCLGTSNVLLNAFLPLLVANHPSIRGTDPAAPLASREDDDDAHDDDDDGEVLLNGAGAAKPEVFVEGSSSPQLQLANRISAKGVWTGYLAAVSVQILSIVILVLFNKYAPSIANSTIPLRLILLIVGIWWACFSIPAALWLRPRPGPPLLAPTSRSRFRMALAYVAFSWTSLWRTIKLALKLRQAWRFLIAWFLLSDAIATIQGTAILFAKTELHMSTASVAVISILAMVGGILGAATWPVVAKRFQWRANHVIIACLLLFEFIPLYGLLGFIPFVKAWGVGGIQKPGEIFPIAFLFGLAMGGLSSYCRSLFGVLIPPGSEAAFYALYAFTDKGSSVVGPTIVGRIVDNTGSIRTSFWFLIVLNLLPLPIIYWLDADAGRLDAAAMADTLSQSTSARGEARFGDEEGEELLERRPE